MKLDGARKKEVYMTVLELWEILKEYGQSEPREQQTYWDSLYDRLHKFEADHSDDGLAKGLAYGIMKGLDLEAGEMEGSI